MTEATARTVTASILVLSIQAYGKRAVGEQLALRARLNAAVTPAISHVAPADRIVVDTTEGAAIVFLADPVDALAAASALLPALAPASARTALPVGGGLNRGPVQLAETEHTLGVVGDGIEVAETLAGFAERGQIVASRSFCDTADSTGATARFQPLGSRTDAGVRAHEIYLLQPLVGPAAPVSPAGRSIRPRAVIAASALAAALVAAGFGAREVREVVEAKRRPGVIRLAVRPAADVIVDSTYKGMAPPLTSLEVPPGRHTVELKRAGHPTRNVQIELRPGEQIELQHTFFEKPKTAPRPKTFWERLGL